MLVTTRKYVSYTVYYVKVQCAQTLLGQKHVGTLGAFMIFNLKISCDFFFFWGA